MRSEEQALPSARSALSLVRGERHALLYVARDMALRSALIAAGLYVAGERQPAEIAKRAVAGATAIEIAVLGIVAVKEWSK